MNRIYQLFRQAYARDHFATISGTATREEFWYFAFGQILIGWIAGFIVTVFSWLGVVSMFSYSDGMPFSLIFTGIIVLAYVIFLLISLIPGFCLTIRRYHDVGLSGYAFGGILLGIVVCLSLSFYEIYSSIDAEATYAPIMADSNFGFAIVFMLIAHVAFIVNLVILALPEVPADENTFAVKSHTEQ